MARRVWSPRRSGAITTDTPNSADPRGPSLPQCSIVLLREAEMPPKNAVNIHLFQRVATYPPNLRLHRNRTCHLMASSWVSGALRGAKRRMWRKLHVVKLTSERPGQRKVSRQRRGQKRKNGHGS